MVRCLAQCLLSVDKSFLKGHHFTEVGLICHLMEYLFTPRYSLGYPSVLSGEEELLKEVRYFVTSSQRLTRGAIRRLRGLDHASD